MKTIIEKSITFFIDMIQKMPVDSGVPLAQTILLLAKAWEIFNKGNEN